MRRMQTLPQEEVLALQSLSNSPQKRNTRLSALHQLGWPLSSLAVATNSPKSTVNYWVKNSLPDQNQNQTLKPLPSPPSPLKNSLPQPQNLRKKSISPKVPPHLYDTIRELSNKSRRYRSKTPSNSDIAVSNRKLTVLALNLRSQGVSTADIARVAGVSYRAMAKRVAKGEKSAT